MKKLVSFLLTLTLLLALAVPAAAELTPPLWEQMGYASLEECLDYEMITAAQYDAIAGKAAGFDAEAYYEATYVDAYGTAEEYKAYWELTDEDFVEWMLYDWFVEEAYAYYEQNQKDQLITSVGGVPGQINVMFNGQCVPFPDTVPEIVSGRTMVPLRSVMEDLGCTVSYDHSVRLAEVEGEGIAFSHYIGTNIITLGDGTTLEMDVNSYIQGGRTMVPLRFFSQALGYDVFWDNYLRTAVIVDKEHAIATINENFTVLNGMMAQQEQTDPAKNYRMDMDFDGSAVIYDTINGNQTYRLSGEIDALYDQQAINLDCALDLSSITALLAGLETELGEAIPAEMLALLSDFTFKAIVSGSQLYLNAPLLGYALEQEGYSLPDSFWVSMDMGETVMFGSEELSVSSMGELLYTMALSSAGDDTFGLYQELGEMSELFTILFGDDTFTKRGSSYKWHFGEEEYMALSEMMYGYSSSLEEDGISEFSMDMTIRTNGSVEFDLVLEAADSYSGGAAMRLEMEGEASDTSASISGELRMRNVCDVAFQLDMTNRETAEEPLTAPAAGELVIDENFPNIPLQ